MIKKDFETLARTLASFQPKGMSVELLPEDRTAIREQLAEHFIANARAFDGGVQVMENQEWFYGLATSPYVAEVTTDG